MSRMPPHRLGKNPRERSASPPRRSKSPPAAPRPAAGYTYSKAPRVRPAQWRKQQYLCAYDHRIHQGPKHNLPAQTRTTSPARSLQPGSQRRSKHKTQDSMSPPRADEVPYTRGEGLALLRFASPGSRERGLSLLQKAQLPAEQVGTDQITTSFSGQQMLRDSGLEVIPVYRPGLALLAQSRPRAGGLRFVAALRDL